MNRDTILMLEDDAERLARFHAAAGRLGVPLVTWWSARRMLAELDAWLPRVRVIALDHDLVPPVGETDDPGDGLEVAKWLAERPRVCPVVIHTSNVVRGDAMEGELQLAGWKYRRISPIGDDWIEVDWYLVTRRLIHPRRGPKR